MQMFSRLWAHAAETPARTAFCMADGDRLSWADLAARVAGAALALEAAPQTIGLALPNGLDYVLADLAVTLAGRRLVPIPHFFSPAQIAHIVADAGIEAMIGPGSDLPRLDDALGRRAEPEQVEDQSDRATRIIYTSGSSGRPKGVVIGAAQLSASLTALSRAVRTGPDEVYLSVLPAAQLLEQICGIFMPILAGAQTVIDPAAGSVLFGGPAAALTAAFARHRPTMSLLAPKLLQAWMTDLAQSGQTPPDSLRFVAIGGAPVSPRLLEQALAAGIPVHEGYGLSEACSVVAVNRPGDNRPGTVGRVLDGIKVSIEDGEIVVSGPTVMQGYLHGPSAGGYWRTGDLGHFDHGRLVIEGRKDNLIVTPAGRNISPEWVEATAETDPRVLCSALVPVEGRLVLVAAPSVPVAPADLAAALAPRLADLPAYARPEALVLADPRHPGLIRPAGTPDRAVARDLAMAGPHLPIDYARKEEIPA